MSGTDEDTWVGMLLGTQRALLDAAAICKAVMREARLAMEGGISVLVAAQHLRSEPYLTLQPWSILSALRAVLPGSSVSVACVIAGLSSGLQVSRELETVGAIGDGPVGVALASGYRREEFSEAGRVFEDRFAARREVMAHLVAAGRVAAPWLWYCAGSERAVGQAVRSGIPWYTPPTMPDDRIGRLLTSVGGTCIVRRDVFTAGTEGEVQCGLERYVASKYAAYRSWGYGEADSVVVGTPDRVTELLQRTLEEVHPEGLVLRLSWPEMDSDAALRHLDLFASAVLPALDRDDRPARAEVSKG